MPARSKSRSYRKVRAEAADWALRVDAGGLSVVQRRAFERWLARDPAHAEIYSRAEAALRESRSLLLSEPELAAGPTKRRRRGAKIAAILIVAGAALALALDVPMRLRADGIAAKGELPVIALADGSTLQLNAVSAVAFDFRGRERVVRLLRGGGYFQVVADAARPFVVEAAGGRTTVLGTAFDVRLTAAGAEVTVLESAVAVSAPGVRDTPLRLQAGQQVDYGADGTLGAVRPVDLETAAAWRRRLLVFDNATVAEIAAEIERHWSGRIIIASGALARRRISGAFNISDPLAAVDVLERTLGIRSIRLGPLAIVLRE